MCDPIIPSLSGASGQSSFARNLTLLGGACRARPQPWRRAALANLMANLTAALMVTLMCGVGWAEAGDASIDDLFGESLEAASEAVEAPQTAPTQVPARTATQDTEPGSDTVPAVELAAPATAAPVEPAEAFEDPASALDDLFVDDLGPDLKDDTQPEAPAVDGGDGDADSDSAASRGLVDSVPDAQRSPIKLSGFLQQELGYIYSGDEHFNKFKHIGKLSARGALSAGVRWQAGVHLVLDPVFAFEDYFADRVEDNYQFYGWVDETYIDFGEGNWEFRLGRQQIIWGETVGLFFADVVSALDLREFILPDFELIRIPQWAARAEYFAGDAYFDLIYIPVATVDRIGEPGAVENGRFVPGGDYYPYPPPATGAGLRQPVFLDADRPGVDFATGGFGARAAIYKEGWDLSAFYYNSLDHAAAPERTVTQTALVYRPTHNRIQQFGSTLAKDFGSVVLKSEAVYTLGRRLPTTRLADVDGLVDQNELRYVVGLDYVRGQHTFNAQFFQFWLPDHVPGLVPDRLESGLSLFASTESLHPDVTPELLWINSLNRNEWSLQAKVTWAFARDWRSVIGVDVFEGPQTSLFGQYDDRDRVYYELRYSF